MGSVTAQLMPIVQVFTLGLFVNMGLRLVCGQVNVGWHHLSLLLSKLIVTVKEAVECEVDLSGVFCWSDSEMTLWKI